MHELYRDPEVHDAVVERWGDEVAPGGVVDRPAIARRAFADPDERALLEELLWPKVGERIAEWRAVESAASRRPGRSSSRSRCCSSPAWSPPSTPRSRSSPTTRSGLSARPPAGMRRSTSGQRASSAQEEKAHRATYAVANSGTLDEFEQKLSSVLVKLTS